LRLHLGQTEAAMNDVRASIDAWWPLVEQGVEGFVMNASGCGVTVREWGHLLRDDRHYAEKARRIATMTRDVSEVVAAELATLKPRLKRGLPARIAFHPPCTLQHGQQLRGVAERILREAGADVRLPVDSHLCCGSAGTYSILQPSLGSELRTRKLEALDAVGADVVASANVGCLAHLQRDGAVPVRHWIELIDDALR
jgi:glycolate oxidase iron-sulfur subunit